VVAPAVEVVEVRRTYKVAARPRKARRGRTLESPDGVVENGRRVALAGVSLRVEVGAWLALLGPNGSGKSTLLRVLATLERPESGDVRVLGEAVAGGGASGASLRRARAKLGVVFQSPGLDPLLTVRENLLCQGALHGLDRGESDRRAGSLAPELGVADRLDDRVGRLSGGLARRVDLARALLGEPELLLLDEPTAGLDHASRADFLDTLERRREAARAGGRPLTIVMTTHLMDEADHADRVALIDRGRIVAEGAPSELRAALGGSVLVAPPALEEELRTAGLAVSIVRGEAVGSGDGPAVERAANALVRRGCAFRVGPPTLGDVYLARTGRRLSGAEEGA
jgi:ABC-2 type transport system ATP-binding protein